MQSQLGSSFSLTPRELWSINCTRDGPSSRQGSQPFAPLFFPHANHLLIVGCLGMGNLSERQLPFAKGDSPEMGPAKHHRQLTQQ